MSKTDLHTRIKRIRGKSQTGVLHVRADGWLDSDLHFMDGELVACGGSEDNLVLGGLLVSAGHIRADDLDVHRDTLQDGEDLADSLVSGGQLEGSAVMDARGALFRDNLAWAAAAPDPTLAWETHEAVFPDNMQFGVDLDEVLADLTGWLVTASPVVQALVEGQFFARAGDRPADLDPTLWEQLGEPRGIHGLLGVLGPPRRAATEAVARWLEAGVIAETQKEGITQSDYDLAARGGFIKSYEVLDKVDLSGVEVLGTKTTPPSDVSMPAIEAIADFDDDELIAAHEHDEDELIAAHEHDEDELIAAHEHDEDELIAAHEHDEDEDVVEFVADDDDEETEVAARASETRPDIAPVADLDGDDADDLELLSDDFAMFDDDADDGDEPPVREFQVDEDGASAEDMAAILDDDLEDAGALATIDQGEAEGPFEREQLNSFHERIAVFNNIFRIIFRTFAEHIGETKSLQRFNALLSSGQRQYPELFENIAVESDGTVRTGPLINNLASCPPGDYGSLLHQGLYELIFSHLYDAKDMLPGDAETEMMEKIVVFERQLHQL